MKQTTLLRQFLIIISLCGSSFLVSSDESYLAPLVKESLLLDIAVGQKSIIVGERGHVLLSSSNNLVDIDSYSQVIAPIQTTLTAVTTVDNFAWAVGHDATIIKSTDAGLTWSLIQTLPELDRPLLDVLFFNQNEGIAVGAYGLFYRTTDGGNNWEQERHPSVLSADDNDYLESIKDDEAFYLEELTFISPHFNRLSISNDKLYLAGEAGLIAFSDDKGKNWERLDIDYYGSFFDVKALPNGEILAVGLRGNMFIRTADGWSPIQTCVTTSLNTISINDQGDVLVGGNNGVILQVATSKLLSSEYKRANNENCQLHEAITAIDTDFSDAVVNLRLQHQSILAITSGGLKTVKIEE